MHAPRDRLRATVCLAAGLLLAPALATAQASGEQVPTFRSDVRLVLHSIAVLDATGRPVEDLGMGDFVVYEDGEPVDMEFFLAPSTAPLDVALVLDSSTSLFPIAAQVRRAASTFLTRLQPQDCVYLLPFSDSVGPGQWGYAADPDLTRRIDSIFMDGGTALYDAVLEGLTAIDRTGDGAGPGEPGSGEPEPAEGPAPVPAGGDDRAANGDDRERLPTRAELLAGIDGASAGAARREVSGGCGGRSAEPAVPGAPSRRRALVLLTDGADQNSVGRFDELLDRARNASIPVFPVVLGEARRDPRLRGVLDTLAGNSGGTVVESVEPAALQEAYDDVVALLRASYLVGYRAPESEPRWREVRIRSRRPSYRLVHRERYYR